jgi:hypothetical protein
MQACEIELAAKSRTLPGEVHVPSGTVVPVAYIYGGSELMRLYPR